MQNYGTDYDFLNSLFRVQECNGRYWRCVIGLNSNTTQQCIQQLVSRDFGDTWLAKNDSQYISANMNSSTDLLINPMTIKETELIKQHLRENLFRYDASELMERRIGSDSLWYALMKYIELKSLYIDEVTEELDASY